MKVIGAGLLALTALALAPAASFADRWDGTRNDYIDHDGYREGAWSAGYDRGQRDGRHQGWDDGKDGRRLEFWRNDDFRDGDSGYNRRFGSRASYVQGYRRGYEEAYRGAYRAAIDRFRRDRDGDRRDWQWRDRRGW